MGFPVRVRIRLMRTVPFSKSDLRDLRRRRARVAATISFLEQLLALAAIPEHIRAAPLARGRVLPFVRKDRNQLR